MDGIVDFWRRLAAARRRLLVLDYDGTLAPFQVERDRAVPLPGVRRALRRLRDGDRTGLAVISGRAAEEVAGLLAVPGVPVWGSHGFELLDADGELTRLPLAAGQREGLERGVALLTDLEPGRLERKQCGLALHTRGLAPGRAEELERMAREGWSGLAGPHRLELRAFDGGVELRAMGQDKGAALARVMGGASRADLTVYIGDDDTDEDAFRHLAKAAGEAGIGVKVGPPGPPTAARGRLDDCGAVLALLERWVEQEGA